MRDRSALGIALLVTTLLVSDGRAARADDTPLAESLFQRGLAAMERGDLPHACELLAASQRLDPGGGTLLNLALCLERSGRVATAWARYHDALGAARRDGRLDRTTFAAEHIESLEGRLPRIALVMREPLAGARAKVDGADLPAAAWETPSPVDPGTHQLLVEAPGRAAYAVTIAVGEGETKRIVVPSLARSAVIEPGVLSSSSGSGQRFLGWTLSGIGGGAIIASAVLGALAIGAESTADASCPGSGACTDPRGLDASDRAATFATAATISAISGLVVLAGGILLLLAAPSR